MQSDRRPWFFRPYAQALVASNFSSITRLPYGPDRLLRLLYAFKGAQARAKEVLRIGKAEKVTGEPADEHEMTVVSDAHSVHKPPIVPWSSGLKPFRYS